MQVRIFRESQPNGWFGSTTTRLRICVDERLVYQQDPQRYDARKEEWMLLSRDEIKISQHCGKDAQQNSWEIVRAGEPIAKVVHRYGICYGLEYFDLEWNGKVFKSFSGLRSLSDTPSLRPSWTLKIWQWDWATPHRGSYHWIDELDPDIAAVLSLYLFSLP